MLTWQDAHRVAHLAAAQAHGRLGVDLDGCRVDVVKAIADAGIQVMWQPMPRLFGAYVNEPDAAEGILLNSGLPRGARRHTAAHELGHAFLKHTTSVDDGSTVDTVHTDDTDAIPSASRRRSWPDQEKTAEAFAAWFLMPRRVVAAALMVLELDRPRHPVDVYRLSLLLGTSYRSTVRHLPNLRLATPAAAKSWMQTAPGAVKAQLDAGAPAPPSRRPDVWLLGPRFDGLSVELEPGDRLVLPAGAIVASGPDWLRRDGSSNPPAQAPVLQVEPVTTPQAGVLVMAEGEVATTVELGVADPPRGLDPRCPR